MSKVLAPVEIAAALQGKTVQWIDVDYREGSIFAPTDMVKMDTLEVKLTSGQRLRIYARVVETVGGGLPQLLVELVTYTLIYTSQDTSGTRAYARPDFINLIVADSGLPPVAVEQYVKAAEAFASDSGSQIRLRMGTRDYYVRGEQPGGE